MATDQEWFEHVNRERSVPTDRRLFTPHLTRQQISRLRNIVADAEGDGESLRWHLEQEVARVIKARRGGKASGMYAASLGLLSDVTAVGWSVSAEVDMLVLTPPDPTSVSKAMIRAALQVERDAQLEDKGTREFLAAMERPIRRGKLGKTNIFSVLTDGDELIERLRPAMQAPVEARLPLLQTLIRPILELVEPGAHCTVSGLRLQDIWRYIRHSWALPYFSTPGRQLLYLIRDEALPHRPVIGIAGLTNAVAQLGPRDEFIGWTLASVRDRLGDSFQEIRMFQALDLAVRTGIHMTRHDDLRISSRDLSRPRPSVIDRLSKLGKAAGQERRVALKRGTKAERVDESSDFWKSSKSPLFRAKRADTMARLLLARMELRKAKGPLPLSAILAEEPEVSGRAISYALRFVKDARMGTAMMDLSVCGAIPPYSYLLGGKLVALLMVSPQVRKDYRARYAKKPAIIASALRGRPVIRETELVMLTTTSLYSTRSSQYNRLRVPANAVGASGDFEYKLLGLSGGWGSVHLSRRTRDLLRELAFKTSNLRNVNYVFGEGVNPKMRAVREGLSALGVASDSFLHHQQPRIVYGVPLAMNAREYLRVEERDPRYLLDEGDPAAVSDRLVDFWRRRWLAPRLDYRPAVDAAKGWQLGPLLSSRRVISGLASVTPGLAQLSLDYAGPHEPSANGVHRKKERVRHVAPPALARR